MVCFVGLELVPAWLGAGCGGLIFFFFALVFRGVPNYKRFCIDPAIGPFVSVQSFPSGPVVASEL